MLTSLHTIVRTSENVAFARRVVHVSTAIEIRDASVASSVNFYILPLSASQPFFESNPFCFCLEFQFSVLEILCIQS